MSGQPTDGLPFWAKGIYFLVGTTVVIYDKAVDLKDKVKAKLKRKK